MSYLKQIPRVCCSHETGLKPVLLILAIVSLNVRNISFLFNDQKTQFFSGQWYNADWTNIEKKIWTNVGRGTKVGNFFTNRGNKDRQGLQG